MAATLPRFIAGRLLAAAAVLAGASLACFLTFHVLRPDMFAGQGSFAHQLGDFLDRMFLHGDLGRSWTSGTGASPTWSPRGSLRTRRC